MYIKMKSFIFSVVLLLTPFFVVHAQDVDFLLDRVISLVSRIVPILAGIALIAFFWGLIKFIVSADSEEGRKAGKNIMVWGVIALFVMFSIWGILVFVGRSLGVPLSGPLLPPRIDLNIPSCIGGDCPAGSR